MPHKMPHMPRRKHEVVLTPLQADFVAATSEFVGMFWFLFFGYAGQLMVKDQAATTPGLGPSATFYVSFACMQFADLFPPVLVACHIYSIP
ncbi:hypothetical protein GGR55DRAFT_673188 [Xylaria sp. FL0064]|nr:hypothetical protein GGR55DRAFT_673188 [Xylaria sp. FL0064]